MYDQQLTTYTMYTCTCMMYVYMYDLYLRIMWPYFYEICTLYLYIGTNKGGSNISNSSDKSSNSGSKRIIAVEKNDGRKELYTASGKRRRDEQRDVKRPRSRSPRPRSPRPPSPPRSRIRSRSPRIRRNTSPQLVINLNNYVYVEKRTK